MAMANPDGNSKAPDRSTPPDGCQIGIELELHLNVPHRYQAAVADVDPAWSAGVW
jgi:hypothetical protein